VHAALEVIASIPLVGNGRRIVAIGEMLELGRYSQTAHEEVGRHIASLPIDLLVTVGEQARDIARAALSAGFPQNSVFTYSRSNEAGLFVQKKMSQGDVVLIKGSQGSRMEKITKEVMADPSNANKLLVRQSKKWLSI
jgi:UDP-N-acetylmuramoyl-tripeptide--D-alanyl-D-alanine ligase